MVMYMIMRLWLEPVKMVFIGQITFLTISIVFSQKEQVLVILDQPWLITYEVNEQICQKLERYGQTAATTTRAWKVAEKIAHKQIAQYSPACASCSISILISVYRCSIQLRLHIPNNNKYNN